MTSQFSKIIFTTTCVLLLATGCATKGETESVKRGAKVGAIGGGVMGLALGAMTGDARIAVAGAAMGAAAGGAGGAMHELQDTRESQRNQIMADAIAGRNSAPEAISNGNDLIQNMLGTWNITVWIIDKDGKRISGSGVGKGIMESKSTVNLNISDIDFPSVHEDMTGGAIFTFDEKKGYTLESGFSTVTDKYKYIGEYVVKENVYNFYATEKDRTSVRLLLRSTNESMWSIETYVTQNGKETQTQSYRFMRQ
ncbi:MAG: hypothetical protein GQ474_06490 [Sulfurimonas sp.]|nr:hypothetical protein [Sulfurimonas sp.]